MGAILQTPVWTTASLLPPSTIRGGHGPWWVPGLGVWVPWGWQHLLQRKEAGIFPKRQPCDSAHCAPSKELHLGSHQPLQGALREKQANKKITLSLKHSFLIALLLQTNREESNQELGIRGGSPSWTEEQERKGTREHTDATTANLLKAPCLLPSCCVQSRIRKPKPPGDPKPDVCEQMQQKIGQSRASPAVVPWLPRAAGHGWLWHQVTGGRAGGKQQPHEEEHLGAICMLFLVVLQAQGLL